MAQKTVVTYTCDLTGEPADETVRFGLDNRTWEIDLTDTHAKELRDSLAPYLEVARRVTAAKKTASRAPARVDREQREAVRAWASENGHHVGRRGRIPEKVQILFNAAH